LPFLVETLVIAEDGDDYESGESTCPEPCKYVVSTPSSNNLED